MKRIFLLILGYFLVIQAGCGVLLSFGKPESVVPVLIVCGLFGWGGYKLIQIARRPAQLPIEDSPTKDLAVPETNRLDRE
jgi:hypothetical protein